MGTMEAPCRLGLASRNSCSRPGPAQSRKAFGVCLWQHLFLMCECILLPPPAHYPIPMLQANSLALPIPLPQGFLHGAKQLIEERALVLQKSKLLE